MKKLFCISFHLKANMQRRFSLGWLDVGEKSVLIDLKVIEAPMMQHKAFCRDHERIYSSSATDRTQCWGFGVLILCDVHQLSSAEFGQFTSFPHERWEESEAKMEKVGQRKENLCQALVFTIIMVRDDEFISAPKPLKKRPSDKSHLNQVINVKILQCLELIYSVAGKKKYKIYIQHKWKDWTKLCLSA